MRQRARVRASARARTPVCVSARACAVPQRQRVVDAAVFGRRVHARGDARHLRRPARQARPVGKGGMYIRN